MAKKEKKAGKEELVDLLGIDVVTSVHRANIKYDKYCDKMLNRKAHDLHLAEWRKIMQACPKRIGARWTTIYEQLQTRMDNLHKIEQEWRIDFSKPLGEHDPLDKLDELAKKKRKHADAF
ncbi:hypothetical protein Tco_1055823 [Tanacetum coccineum]|uniref:Uncharacterized protein n=1 Tax=Tanacetum coccineum TaxID=301880 RepID=A0ABQ5H0S8_9ASTR